MSPADWISLTAASSSVLLSILTIIYVVYTKTISDSARATSNLTSAPVVIFDLKTLHIGSKFGPDRQAFNIEYRVRNVGTGPALNLRIDAEIEFEHIKIEGLTSVLSRFEPEQIFVLAAGDQLDGPTLVFGNRAVSCLVANFRESDRLNMERIRLNPAAEAYRSAKIHLNVYYQDAINRTFVTRLTADISPLRETGEGGRIWGMPDRDENIDVMWLYIPKPKLFFGAFSDSDTRHELASRDERRDLSGW